MMTGTKELIFALRAGYPFFHCQTFEMDRTVQDIIMAINEFKNEAGESPYAPELWDLETGEGDPNSCYAMLSNATPGTVVVAKNLNWFLRDKDGDFEKSAVQMLQNSMMSFTSAENRTALIIVSDSSLNESIPGPLQRDFLPITFDLPGDEEIKKAYDLIIRSVEGKKSFKKPSPEEEKNILASCKGMTEMEIKKAIAYAIIKDGGELTGKTVAILQAREVEKTAGLKIGKYDISADSLKGYDNLKSFVLQTIGSIYALGVMLLGPPGTGKTHFCKWIASMTGMKVIEMEMAELFGGLVGQSEELMIRAIQVIKANAPCILFIDEIEKGLAGVRGGDGDNGTTKRSMSQFLKFLSDGRPEGLYVMATCNDISSLPPEWVRAERWDCAPWFIDIPNSEERKAILEHYIKEFNIQGKLLNSKMEGWSGAEIRSVCRIASMMGKPLNAVKDFVIPVSKTMGEEIDYLRKWAKNKTLPASEIKVSKPKDGKFGIELN